MNQAELTGKNNYFEDFEVGTVIKHFRGKTVTENEAVTICHMVMNTAQGHFSDHYMLKFHEMGLTPIKESLVYGGVTISIVIGLAYQDTGEQVIKELGMDQLKLLGPVLHKDTLYAYTEVLSKSDTQDNAGEITFKHYGVNHKNDVVFTGERTALIRKRGH